MIFDNRWTFLLQEKKPPKVISAPPPQPTTHFFAFSVLMESLRAKTPRIEPCERLHSGRFLRISRMFASKTNHFALQKMPKGGLCRLQNRLLPPHEEWRVTKPRLATHTKKNILLFLCHYCAFDSLKNALKKVKENMFLLGRLKSTSY